MCPIFCHLQWYCLFFFCCHNYRDNLKNSMKAFFYWWYIDFSTKYHISKVNSKHTFYFTMQCQFSFGEKLISGKLVSLYEKYQVFSFYWIQFILRFLKCVIYWYSINIASLVVDIVRNRIFRMNGACSWL